MDFKTPSCKKCTIYFEDSQEKKVRPTIGDIQRREANLPIKDTPFGKVSHIHENQLFEDFPKRKVSPIAQDIRHRETGHDV